MCPSRQDLQLPRHTEVVSEQICFLLLFAVSSALIESQHLNSLSACWLRSSFVTEHTGWVKGKLESPGSMQVTRQGALTLIVIICPHEVCL